MSKISQVFGLFPGQGSQQVGMGRDLFESFELAREMFAIADRALGFSLSTICFEGPAERLQQTEITQPAILTVSSICFALLQNSPNNSYRLAAAAGHSLGEYSALVAAGALSFEDAVLLVHKRGRYMQEAVPLGEGKMAAVLGRELAELEQVLASSTGIAQIANINAPGQIVVAGSRKGVDEFVEKLGKAKVKELPVSAPFHCELMQPAAKALTQDLEQITIKPCRFPVYANYTAQPVTAPEEIREALKLQVCGRVRWVECVENALAQTQPQSALEFGTGKVLSGLLRRINRSLSCQLLGTVENFEKLFQTSG